ncbi:MAG TPA: TadE/TadG family type IV pilus assembly protein [Gaiellaceae bacterium]|nr:TadE/TadG family type IV pilus assembly protein [Gaiellaceae bacterium]HSJ94120.1 TadE/TadG family type IV pilus assembly protein [Gaiellaceae bacterium]
MLPSRFAGRNPEEGAALVEFALVLPVLLVLLLGMLDFGKAFNYWIDQTHLANEGARWAAVNKNPGGGSLQQYVRSQANTPELRDGGTASVAGPIQICITFPNGTSQVGDPVRVTASTTYNWLPFLGSRLGIAQTTMTASATMRLEAAPSVYGAGCS